MNLIEILIDNSLENKKGIYFIDINRNEKFVSYKQLYRKSLNILYKLQEKKIKKGAKVILQIQGNEDYMYSFWACILGGFVPVPLPIIQRTDDIKKLSQIIRTLEESYLLTNIDLTSTVMSDVDSEYLDDLRTYFNNHMFTLSSLTNCSKLGKTASVDKNDLAVIQFSSGTTGIPKGVMCTHNNILINMNDLINIHNIGSHQSTVTWMPLTHNTGMMALHILPILNNMNQYSIDTIIFLQDPSIWFDVIDKYKCNISISPNFGYKLLLDKIPTDHLCKWDLSSLDFILNGAEPISELLCKKFVEVFSNSKLKQDVIYPSYGLAECCLCVSTCKEVKSVKLNRNNIRINVPINEIDEKDENCIRFVVVGSALEHVKIRICDDFNNILEENHIGNIQVKGEIVTKGYFNRPEINSDLLVDDGWLKTGDIGFLYNNELVITGRAKDVIFINGQNFYSHDIENILKDSKLLETIGCAVCGIANEKTGSEELIVFVENIINVDDFSKIKYEIKKIITSHLGLGVQLIIPINSIPKTSSGKIQRFKLLEQYKNGDFKTLTKKFTIAMDTNEKKSDICKLTNYEIIVIKAWQQTLGVNNISPNDNFFYIGGDSIKAMNVLGILYKDFNITLYDLYKYQTVKELGDRLRSCLDGSVFENVSPLEIAIDSIQTNNYEETSLKILELDIHEIKNYKEILLTGVTGYLGIHLFTDLIRNTHSNITVIIRAKNLEEARTRLLEKISFYFKHSNNIISEFNRVTILNGDLNLEKFGLSDNVFNDLSFKIDAIINSAANVKHYGIYKNFENINVKAVNEIVSFAKMNKTKDIHHMSTIAVGLDYNNNNIYECNEDSFYANPSLENLYIYSKTQAENILINCRKEGISATIYRIGELVSNYETGTFQQNIEENALYSMLKGLLNIKIMPNYQNKCLDFSFVDEVSLAIVKLFNKRNLLNNTYHIYNPNRLSLNDLGSILNTLSYKIDIIDKSLFETKLKSGLNNDRLRNDIVEILINMDMIKKQSEEKYILTNKRTTEILSKLGFKYRNVSKNEIDKILSYCKSINFIK